MPIGKTDFTSREWQCDRVLQGIGTHITLCLQRCPDAEPDHNQACFHWSSFPLKGTCLSKAGFPQAKFFSFQIMLFLKHAYEPFAESHAACALAQTEQFRYYTKITDNWKVTSTVGENSDKLKNTPRHVRCIIYVTWRSCLQLSDLVDFLLGRTFWLPKLLTKGDSPLGKEQQIPLPR